MAAGMQELSRCLNLLKLSCMALPLMKALWFSLTSLAMKGVNQRDRTLANNLLKLWIKLIGRKSVTSAASFFFQSSIIYA
jgi:hypothetical protein